jgi:protein arginine kinase activator
LICQECGKKPATLHFTKILNGDKTEFHFCDTCAREKGEMLPGSVNGFSIHNLLSGLIDFEPAGGTPNSAPAQPIRCENCGLTYSQFSKIGRFGCSHCYKSFGPRLDPLFRRVHGNTVHMGKVPTRSGGQIKLKKDIEQLKKELQYLIEQEEFEKAAEIRDQIRTLEQQFTQS